LAAVNVAMDDAATGPEATDQLEANGSAYPTLAAINQNPASLADDALRP
jgi:hypothetical protein